MQSDNEAGGSAGVRGKTHAGPRIFRAAGGRSAVTDPATGPGASAARDADADRATLHAIRDAAQAGELGRAGDMAEAALQGGLEHPFLLNLCALKLETAGRLQEAAALLRRAVELAPRDPDVLNALGLCLSALERTQEALATFDAVLALQPGLAAAHCNRGGMLETLGQLAAAEASYRRALAPGAARRSRTEGAAGGTRTHVFLLGFPRSGTTLLEQALAGHPDVETLSEHEPLTDAMHAFLGEPAGLERLAGAGEAELDAYRDSYWRQVRAAGAAPGGKVFIDKHPLNTFKLPLIVKLFPEARILFARRDPRDVVLSCFRRRFRMSAPMYELLTLEGAAALYVAAMELASRLQGVAPMDLRVLSHEDLVADFEAELRGVCSWLRLDWTPALHDFPARARAVATPSGSQLRSGLNADGIGQWRRYGEQLRPVLAQLDPWVARFGYDAPRAPARGRRMETRSAAW